MTEVLGLRTVQDHRLPTGVDGTRLAEWEKREGLSWQEYINLTDAAINQLNAELVSSWGWLTFLTTEQMFEYADGGSITASPMVTDEDVVDVRHVTTLSHMIALETFQDGLGATKKYLRDARRVQIDADIAGAVLRMRQRYEVQLLNRCFLTTDYTIGSAGYNVPWVHSTTGAVDFTPPFYGGETFAGTHDHFLGVNSASYGYGDMLNQMAEHLQEHGHIDPYIAVVSRSNISSYYDLADFVRPVGPNTQVIDLGGDTSNTPKFFTRNRLGWGHIGYFNSEYGEIMVMATARVPSGYAFLTKSYGLNNAKNPLAVRYHPDEGFGIKVIPEYTTVDNQFPLKNIRFEFEYGIGVGWDRTNGVAAYLVNGGVWTNPTIS